MGRQIQFYMLPDDRNAFLGHIQERDAVTVIARDSDCAEVHPAAGVDFGLGNTLCLWNRVLLPHLERKWIPSPGYYRVDSLRLPILEFMPSFTAIWEGKPALGQGRLFGNFERHLAKPECFAKWYDNLARWIQQNYQKNPASTGGYVGPKAYKFYKNGGYFLPNVLPPRTQEWLAEIGKQHGRFKAPVRVLRRKKDRP